MGFYVHAFRLTLYYLAYFDKIEETNNFTKYRIIMNQICNYGGDTDTNAAITGSIAGAMYGKSMIPDRWINTVRKKDYLIQIGEQFKAVIV